MDLIKTFVNTKVETKRKDIDNHIEDDQCQGQWNDIENGLWCLPPSQCRQTPEVEANTIMNRHQQNRPKQNEPQRSEERYHKISLAIDLWRQNTRCCDVKIRKIKKEAPNKLKCQERMTEKNAHHLVRQLKVRSTKDA